MNTCPAPLHALAGADADLDEFRIDEPREIASMLRKLCVGNVPLHLHASDGTVYTTTLWALDTERGNMSFCADPSMTPMQALLDARDIVVVGYLNSVKLQFEVKNLVLVRGARVSVLRCTPPGEMFRFQRRSAYRVRPLMRSAPTARIPGTSVGSKELALRVIDVSIGGCALFLGDAEASIEPGTVLEGVEIDLDADTRFHVSLRLQHITWINAEARGVRLGFEFVRAGGEALRSLQRFIDQNQKRGKLLALS